MRCSVGRAPLPVHCEDIFICADQVLTSTDGNAEAQMRNQ